LLIGKAARIFPRLTEENQLTAQSAPPHQLIQALQAADLMSQN